MRMQMASVDAAKPALMISESDCDFISDLALVIEARQPELARQLMNEMDRAEIMDATELPPHVVALGSQVEYLDAGSQTKRTVQLVRPVEANMDQGRVSILTPLGAALIGMSAGAGILWPRQDGSLRVLEILSVRQH